jgi:uncharacterized protein (TIGR00251 family)
MKISVHIHPNSDCQEIHKISDNEYKISLKKSPEKNKANIELLKLLKKHFRAEVKILKGKTSKNKIIEVKGEN